jgi:hypothetical protein
MRSTLESFLGTGQVPWIPYAVGVMTALMLQLLGISPLAFGLGMYMPMALNAPIFFGAVVASVLKKGVRDEKEAQTRSTRGTIIASGFIAGAALMGVALNGLKSLSWGADLVSKVDVPAMLIGSGSDPVTLARALNWLGLAAFFVLCLSLYSSPPVEEAGLNGHNDESAACGGGRGHLASRPRSTPVIRYGRNTITPYVSHPYRVMFHLLHAGVTDPETLRCGAPRHDRGHHRRPRRPRGALRRKASRRNGALTKDKRKQEEEREDEYFSPRLESSVPGQACKLADTYDNLTDAVHLRPEQATAPSARPSASCGSFEVRSPQYAHRFSGLRVRWR